MGDRFSARERSRHSDRYRVFIKGLDSVYKIDTMIFKEVLEAFVLDIFGLPSSGPTYLRALIDPRQLYALAVILGSETLL